MVFFVEIQPHAYYKLKNCHFDLSRKALKLLSMMIFSSNGTSIENATQNTAVASVHRFGLGDKQLSDALSYN